MGERNLIEVVDMLLTNYDTWRQSLNFSWFNFSTYHDWVWLVNMQNII